MSSRSDTSKLITSSKSPDHGNMETDFDKVTKTKWTSVTEEPMKGKIGSETPSPGKMTAVMKPKKCFLKKRNTSDLHSVSSEISVAVEKKKYKTGPRFKH
jgi:hypothetical protein